MKNIIKFACYKDALYWISQYHTIETRFKFLSLHQKVARLELSRMIKSFQLVLMVSASGLTIGVFPAKIPPKTKFSIMTKLPVKSTWK